MVQNNTIAEIRNELFALGDKGYAAFHSKLIPNVPYNSIIGVRTPVLRKYAKSISGTEKVAEFLKVLPHRYYDENNLHAFLLEEINDYDFLIAGLDRFLPYVDNWATCDMLRPKVFSRYKNKLSEKALEWMRSEHTFAVRFGIEVLMTHFLDKDFSEIFPRLIAEIQSDEYYINMMRAWYFATALAKHYDEILPYFERCILDVWTHNKAIRKAIESYRITPQQKNYLRTLTVK